MSNPRRRAEAISVIIPAHNEEAVIIRCLSSLLDGAEDGELDVIVVPNGCTDKTAALAASFGPPVRVVESPIASKSAALNVGDRAATTFPRIYIDADVEIGIDSVRAVADVLRRGDVEVAAPRMRVELAGRPWAIRAYYSVWMCLPYHREDMVGSGVYALSESARGRFEAFPEDRVLFADDRLVRTLAPRDQRRSIEHVTFTIHAPYSVISLMRIRRRMYLTNLTAERTGAGEDAGETVRQRAAIRALGRDPRRWPSIATYVVVVVTAKLGARWLARTSRAPRWDRDDTARQIARDL